MKKIVPKTMNFGLPNLTKQKKKPRKTTKCHIKKNPRNTTKCHNIFAIFFIPSCGRFQFEIIILFFTSTAFSQQILGKKLLLVLKLYIKNKQTKRKHKKIVRETVNFGSPNLAILKKKSKNTTKYYNIFTIPSLLGSEEIFFILYERNAISIIFLGQNLNDKLLLVLN